MKTIDEIMLKEYEKERNSKRGLVIAILIGGVIGITGGFLLVIGIFELIKIFFLN